MPFSRSYRLWSCIGGLFIAITLPCALVVWRNSHAATVSQLAEQLFFLETVATVFCSPLGLLFAIVVFGILSKEGGTAGEMMASGVKHGIIAAALNVPAYLCVVMLRDDWWPLILVRFVSLFIVAGASAGFWIGWQAFRSLHREAPFWPQFSLKSLLIFVLAWGSLLALFMPKS